MAALLYLDVDDEITSAASRIRGADENRVALVIPYGSRLATSRINFRLLAREAQGRGRILSIVAADSATRALAASAGLPVFGTVGEFEEAQAGPPPSAPDGTGSPAAAATATVVASDPEVDAPAAARPSRRRRRPEPASSDGGASDDLEATAVIPAVAGPAPDGAATTRRGAAVGRAPGTREAAASATDAVPLARGRSRGPAWPFGRTVGIAVGAAIALALLAVGVVAYLLLPSAEVTITARMERVGPIPLEIRADPDATEPDPATATVPARRLTFDVAVSDTFPTEGRRVEETRATGSVQFTSENTFIEVTVPSGTRVATRDGVAFVTTRQVVVERASFAAGPARASAPVQAVRAGSEGNVEPGTITEEPQELRRLLVTVNNPSATSGGTREEFPRVSQEDVDAAIEALGGRIDEEFETILADPAGTPPGHTLFPETRALGDPLPTTDPATLVGQEVPEFTLGLATTGTVIAVDEAPVEVLARERIGGEVEAGYELVDGSIEIAAGDPQVDGETITFPVSAQAAQVRVIDLDALREQIKGKPVGQARTLLEPYGLVDIRVWPDWVTAIPTIDARLTLRAEPPAGLGGPGASPRPGSPSAPASGEPRGEASEGVDPGPDGEAASP